MRYLFKTSYRQDLTIWRHSGDIFWYGLLAIVMAVLPFVLGNVGTCWFPASPLTSAT